MALYGFFPLSLSGELHNLHLVVRFRKNIYLKYVGRETDSVCSLTNVSHANRPA